MGSNCHKARAPKFPEIADNLFIDLGRMKH